MVESIKKIGIRYVAAMPGSTFRGIHESIINYGGNVAPELISCVHEEASAALAHGYAKVAGEPMACLVHSNVGLQHASMAIYNAWCDRVPLIVFAGNSVDATKRRPGVEWLHAAQDLAALVRDFVKWDDLPASLEHYAESLMRAYQIATTPPCGPVLLVLDCELQERAIAQRAALKLPRRTEASPPAAASSALERAAGVLAQASSPVIVVDRAARNAEGVALLVKLSELLLAPVIDRGFRMNMPTDHFLNQTFLQSQLIHSADVILALEVADLWGVIKNVPDLIERNSIPLADPNVTVIAISASYLYQKANMQDSQRFYPPELTIAADAQTCLPQLIALIEKEHNSHRSEKRAARGSQLRAQYQRMRERAAQQAAAGWDSTPISTARLCMEIWEQIKDLDWALVSGTEFVSRWPQRLWDIRRFHQYIGGDGAYGVGYGLPGAAGAALAHRDAGRIAVSIQTDGDLMVLPGVLWTLAHHRIPLLSVMHNNRAWHQETMHLQRMSSRRDRHSDRFTIGTMLDDPFIDYAAMARSMGVWAEGPIERPELLAPALARALVVVRSGKPALLDVITQPR